jgi:ribosomal protein S3
MRACYSPEKLENFEIRKRLKRAAAQISIEANRNGTVIGQRPRRVQSLAQAFMYRHGGGVYQ